MTLALLSHEALLDREYALGMEPCATTYAAIMADEADGVRGGWHYLPVGVPEAFVTEHRLRGRSLTAWMRAHADKIDKFKMREKAAPYYRVMQEFGLPLT